jgi:2-keto-4-pentenoate hydratase
MVLAAGLDGPAPITAEQARDAVAYLVPAIEIVDMGVGFAGCHIRIISGRGLNAGISGSAQ